MSIGVFEHTSIIYRTDVLLIDMIFIIISLGTSKQKAVQLIFMSKNITYWKR